MVTELVFPGTTPAYANYGRWVADCGYPDRCSGAAQLARFQGGFICPDCGTATEVIWPPSRTVEAVERLLMMRPHYKNRNWFPGETVTDLIHENGLHGIFKELPSVPPGTVLLSADDHGITKDALPATRGWPALTAGDR